MLAKSLMIQGTTSDAGKSTLALGICRLLHRAGKRTAPFKPQNMALNSAVTVDGGEIGRAQALQAIACGIEPHSDMNPILLKPSSNSRAQVIVHGKVWQDLNAREYHANKKIVMPFALESFHRLQTQYDCIVVEGAGSPAEINLRENDVANMGFANAADIPVLLVSDIDRGGVFAHLYGTYKLLEADEQQRIIGFVINKFRGDETLLESGITWLEEATGKPVLGVIPYLTGLTLDAEDSMNRTGTEREASTAKQLRIVIPELPRMSNHTDFEPLVNDDNAHVSYCQEPSNAGASDLVILPGSKSVISDLAWLLDRGWKNYILRHLRYGGRLLGICGGFQMLGDSIADPYQLESDIEHTSGLGLLRMTTSLFKDKTILKTTGRISALDNAVVAGYEIHMGVSKGPALSRPALTLERGSDGAFSEDEQIIGTYLHGLFDTAASRKAIWNWCEHSNDNTADFYSQREQSIDRVADTLKAHTDWDTISSFLCN
jgi:adenosylcobyric acid synthase